MQCPKIIYNMQMQKGYQYFYYKIYKSIEYTSESQGSVPEVLVSFVNQHKRRIF